MLGSRRAMFINLIAIAMLVFVFAIGAVALYGVLAPLNNWPDIQWPEKEGTQ